MQDLLTREAFTDYVVDKLQRFNISVKVPEPLVVELHYGEDEPVLSIPLKNTYEQYEKEPQELDDLIQPYVTEIGWSVEPPRYPARRIFEQAMPVMKDVLRDPIPEEGESRTVEGKEVVMRLPKGPLLFQELITRPEERLIVQFVLFSDAEILDLHRGDILTCFPEPAQMATIAIQNLGRRSLESGLTTRSFKVENFHTEPLLVGFRDESLSPFVASLINVGDVMMALETNLEATEGMLVSIPSRDQMFISTDMSDQALCELWLLTRHLKSEARYPASGLIWRFGQGEIKAVQTVSLQEEEGGA